MSDKKLTNKMTFEQLLERDGVLVYTNVGTSMLPLIRQGRDLLIIKKAEGRLKKYDVALYRRDSGQYVLHRILKVRKDDYVICGDNQYRKETGITDRQVIGVLTGIVRDGKEFTLDRMGSSYKWYLFFRCDLFLIRAAMLRAKGLLNRWKHK